MGSALNSLWGQIRKVTTLQDRMLIALKAGYTPAVMARAAGVDTAAVSHWSKGRTKSLKAKSALGLATLTGWNAEWWSSGKGPRDAAPPGAPAVDSGTPAYMAELTAKLSPALQEKLVAFAELLASPQGDRLRFQFSIAERAELPTKARQPHK